MKATSSARPRVRRGFLLAGALGLVLLALDSVQRWAYVHRTPVVSSLSVQGEGPLTRVIMVAGQGLDEAENATSRRDLAAASQALLARVPGRLEIKSMLPGHRDYSKQSVLEAIASTTCDHLVLYLTGHGGGVNFGAVGGFKLNRLELALALSESQFKRATVVIDCCWSGAFAWGLRQRAYTGEVTLVTSTDADHPSPFPVSFLSPLSYGRVYFDNWDNDALRSFEKTNAHRARLRWLFSKKFGLQGEIRAL